MPIWKTKAQRGKRHTTTHHESVAEENLDPKIFQVVYPAVFSMYELSMPSGGVLQCNEVCIEKIIGGYKIIKPI